MTPAVVAEAGVPMERATGLHSTVERTAGLLGAAAAGGLVAWLGAADALVVDALSFGLSATVLAWATAAPTLRGSRQARPTEASYATELREGWTFLRGDRILLGIAVMVSLTNLLDMAYAAVLVPVWAEATTGSAATVGLVFATFGGGAAIGSVCAAAWADAAAALPDLPDRVPGLRRAAVRRLRARPAAVVGARRVRRRRLRGRLHQPDPGRGHLRADPGAADGPGHLAQHRDVLRADPVRRPPRRPAGRGRRPLTGAADRGRGVPPRHDAARRRPALARDRRTPGARAGAGPAHASGG